MDFPNTAEVNGKLAYEVVCKGFNLGKIQWSPGISAYTFVACEGPVTVPSMVAIINFILQLR